MPDPVVATVHPEVAGRVVRLSGQKFRSMPGATQAGYGMETPKHSSILFTSHAPPAVDVRSLPHFAAEASRDAHAEMDEVATGGIDSEFRALRFG